MDLHKSFSSYIHRVLDSTPGVKVLLLDAETTPILSVAFTQSQLLAKEVYLTDRIGRTSTSGNSGAASGSGDGVGKHMKALCFLRPSQDALQALSSELRRPRFSEYYLFFTNMLKKSQIERLAEVDEFELVRQVQEVYGDYLVCGEGFSLNVGGVGGSPACRVFGDSFQLWDGPGLARCIDGLAAVLLSLKKRPLIRYQKNSLLAKRLGTELHALIQQEHQLFDFRRPDTQPLLMLLDRKNDPITPLVSPWTYQAMVHDLLGIRNGRVDLSGVADVRAELKEIVLNADHDLFFKRNQYLNLGELGENIKQYVEDYQQKTKSSTKIESIAEMKRFVEEYPEFRKLSGNVSKHVTLVSELSKRVERGELLQVGEVEQSLACFDNHAVDYKMVVELLSKPNVPKGNKVRLVMLYALRYEKSVNNNLPALMHLLQTQAGVDEREARGVQAMLKYAGAEQRQEDVFGNESILSRGKSVFKGLKGAENVYEQHEPLLAGVLDQLAKNRVKDHLYPFVDGQSRDRVQDVVVFIVGGVTYAELKMVSAFNATNNLGVRVVLGGTSVVNAAGFVNDVLDGFGRQSR